MRQKLITALARHAGQTLTPEVAIAIVREAVLEVDASINPRQFGEQKMQDFTMQAERIAGNEIDLDPIHAAYHASVKMTEDDTAYAWAKLREAERAGTRVMFTARDYNRRLIAVLRVKVGMVFETQKLHVSDDMFYVEPGSPAIVPMALWKFAEKKMFEFGVREVSFTSLNIHEAERLAFALGYEKVADVFTKSAQEASSYGETRRRRPTKARHASDPQF